jgi:uncharacterized damage-inducible protein DinB
MTKTFSIFLASLLLIQAQACTTENSLEMTPKKTTETDSLDWIVDELIVKWTNNKSYTIAIIEAMPEEHFDFVPAKDMKSFKKQAAHIVTTLHWQMETLGFADIPKFKGETKDEILASYETLFDYILTELKSMKGDQLSESVTVFYGESSKRRLLNLMDNHVAHHRGQLIVYLRLKGIAPAKYKGW